MVCLPKDGETKVAREPGAEAFVGPFAKQARSAGLSFSSEAPRQTLLRQLRETVAFADGCSEWRHCSHRSLFPPRNGPGVHKDIAWLAISAPVTSSVPSGLSTRISPAGYRTGYRIPALSCSLVLRRLAQKKGPSGHQLPRALELPLQRRHLPMGARECSFWRSPNFETARISLSRSIHGLPWRVIAGASSTRLRSTRGATARIPPSLLSSSCTTLKNKAPWSAIIARPLSHS